MTKKRRRHTPEQIIRKLDECRGHREGSGQLLELLRVDVDHGSDDDGRM